MGLFDFVKNAGEKIFGRDDTAAKAATAEEQKKAELAAERRTAARMVEVVQGLGLEVDDLAIKFDDGVVTVGGAVDSQADREKVILVLGNTQGVGRVDDRLKVVKPEPESQFYTVKRGDSLSKIAKQVYGNAMKYPIIFEANKPMLKHPDKIYADQVLRIPPLED
ncbi:MAG: peptidoglycan-binding protein LysM [Acidobacteriota bacterium]|nr:peptidoglycan-binding protein LysM [Acidobacteriota bacterium]